MGRNGELIHTVISGTGDVTFIGCDIPFALV